MRAWLQATSKGRRRSPTRLPRAASISGAAASRGSTTSRSAAGAHRGSRAWRRRSRPRRSRMQSEWSPSVRLRICAKPPPRTVREAAAAYRLIPRRLLTSVPAGPWIRLYSFDRLTVLNAQLQATISLGDYATAAEDAAAGALAKRMADSAAATLPRFDTGYWSYYALPREPSPVDYHRYVVQLLTRLAKTDPRFSEAAKRFAAYEKQPPAFQLANGGVGQVRFWLSKPATVVADTPAGPSKRIALLDGWHTLTWDPKHPGVYPVHLAATDWNGHRFEVDAPPVVRVGSGTFTPVAPAAADGEGLPAFIVANRVTVVWPDGATVPDPAVPAGLAATPSPVM